MHISRDIFSILVLSILVIPLCSTLINPDIELEYSNAKSNTNLATPVFQDGATATVNVAENNVVVGTYTATDSDEGTTLDYSIIAAGEDANSVDHDLFSINSATGALIFSSAPDYEAPSCGVDNSANVCQVVLSVTDGQYTDTISIHVDIIDENDVIPIVVVNETYLHPEAAATTFQTYTIVDTDTIGSYACSLGGTDAADFIASISGKVCTVVFTANPDYENPSDADSNNVYDITLSFNDGTNALAAQTTAITVTNVNEVPVFQSIPEIFSIVNQSYSYSIFYFDDGGSSNSIISAHTLPSWLSLSGATLSGMPSYSDIGTHSVVIVITDSDGLTAQQDFEIVVIENCNTSIIVGTDVVSSDSDYGVGETLEIMVQWCDIIYSIGSPTIALSNGEHAVYTSGSGNNALLFTYTVVEGDSASSDLTLVYLAGTIQDANNAMVNMSIDCCMNLTPTITIDGDAPDLVSVQATDGVYEIGNILSITATWDEAVIISGTPTLILSNGASASYASGSGSTSLAFIYMVAEGDTASSDLTVGGSNGVITDVAGGAAASASADLGSVIINQDLNYLYMSISSNEVVNGGTYTGSTVQLTFTSSGQTSDFSIVDIHVQNGIVTGFASVSSDVFVATATAVNQGVVAILIQSDSFTSTDEEGAILSNTETFFTWQYTPNIPTITVTSIDVTDGGITGMNDVQLFFESSETSLGFFMQHIYSQNCVIYNFTLIDAFTHSAMCGPIVDGEISVSVLGDVFQYDNGLFNLPSNTITWYYDSTSPELSITSSVENGATSGDPELWLTFNTGESTNDFTIDDIYVINGSLSAFTKLTDMQYMVLLTPLGMTGILVEVPSSSYNDSVGNSNVGDEFSWFYQDLDSDGDGTSDYHDLDDDNDGVPDSFDDLPLDSSDYIDTDGDGIGNTADLDDDGDQWDDSTEIICDSNPLEGLDMPIDTDYDGTCDLFDDDDDNDGVFDLEDDFPLSWSESIDTDGDGNGNNADLDDDNDGVTDLVELSCLSDSLDSSSLPMDTDNDGICDPMDADSDGDNIPDSSDAFPLDYSQWKDDDNDGLGDNPNGLNSDPYPNDRDNDGYIDSIDPFPLISTPGDMDNDGVLDYNDKFPAISDEWADFDEDGIGDNSDPDDDGDGYSDIVELRELSDPFDSNSKPVEGFEIVLPGTWGGEKIAIGAWDLVSIFGGGPLVLWLIFSFVTRNQRSEKVESKMRGAKTRRELNDIAERTEYLLMLRLLGVHQGIKLERIRAELDDVIEAREGTDFAELDQTQQVETQMQEDISLRSTTINDLESIADDLIDE